MENVEVKSTAATAYVAITDENLDELLQVYYANRKTCFLKKKHGDVEEATPRTAKWLMVVTTAAKINELI